MVTNMQTNPATAQDRIRAALIHHARSCTLTGTDWGALLGLGRVAWSDRLRGRTPFTLSDAIVIAHHLEESLDALVGDDDMPLGFTPTDEEELPAGAPLEEHPRAFTASVSPLRFPRPGIAPAYEDVTP